MNDRPLEQPDNNYVHTESFARVFYHLEQPRCQHLLVLGGPGSGKSTLVRQVSLHFQGAGHLVISLPLRGSRSLEELVPQLIGRLIDSLPAPASSALDHVRRAHNSVSLADASSAMSTVLESVARQLPSGQRIFIVLDGLDEVMPDQAALLGQRMIDWFDGVSVEHGTIVLTSRQAGSFLRSSFDRPRHTLIELGDWSSRDLREMVERRLRSRNLMLPERLIGEAVDASEGSPLLAMMTLEHVVQTGQLPQLLAVGDDTGLASALRYSLAAFASGWGNPEQFWSILLVCWASGRIQQDQLERALRADADPALRQRLAAWLSKAEARGFIARDDNGIVANKALDLAVMDELLPAGIDVDRLVFGDEAAERDKLLASSFDEPKDIPEILDGSRTIILGDRGAGKSAIYHSLTQRAADARAQGTIVAASKNPADFLLKMGSANYSEGLQFKALWLLYVASLAARELQSRVDLTSAHGRRYRDDCHRLLRSLGQHDDIEAPSWMAQLASPLRALLPEKVSFTVGPVKIEQAFGKPANGSSKAVDISDFLQRSQAALERDNLRLVVVFDQVDEAHKYQKCQEQMIQGLLMAESTLAQTQSIRLVVLLRTDLYEIYHIEEKNKVVSRTARLSWKPAQLAQQLLLRAYSNAQLNDVAARLKGMGFDQPTRELIQMRILFPAEIESKEFWHWLMDELTTGNRRVSPRQIVLFMNLLKEEAKGGGDDQRLPLYSEVQVLAALRELSRLSFNEVIDDFKVATVLVQNCRANNLHRLRFADVERLADPSQGTPAAQVDQLRRLGFFEHAAGQENGLAVSELKVASLYRRFWT